MKKLFLSFVFSMFLIARVAIAAKDPFVDKIVGHVTYNKNDIKLKERLQEKGILKTDTKSFVRIYVPNWNSSIVVGPNTEMDLDFRKDQVGSKRYELKDGICRWVSYMKSDQLHDSHIYTKTASMGVRGTDFEIQHREKSAETEIIVFSGKVLLQSNLEKSEKLIQEGYWGGVGGKFGKSVAEPVKLTSEQLEKAKQRTKEHTSFLHRSQTSKAYSD